MSPLLLTILALLILGALLFWIIPDSPAKALAVKALTFIVVVLLVVWVLVVFGVLPAKIKL